MKNSKVLKAIVACIVLLWQMNISFAEKIDPDNDDSQYVWAENIGWINLDLNDTYPNTGVANNGAGRLTRLAWGENVGWIHFQSTSPTSYKVQICSPGFSDQANFVDDWLDNGSIPGNLDLTEDFNFKDYSIVALYWLD